MNEFIITLDVDWAPDFVIDSAASILRAGRVRSTWFVTHPSAAIDRLREDPDLFELGLHPNFLPGSTHGNTPAEVMAHTLAVVPEAQSVRTHGLAQSGPILSAMMEAGIRTDVSLFLPDMPHLRPFEFRLGGNSLWRIPYCWSDDYEMEKVTPCWQIAPLLKRKGLKVLNFHPIHLYFNAANPQYYQPLKQRVPRLNQLTPDIAKGFIQSGPGVQDFFREMVEHLGSSRESKRIKDIQTVGVVSA